MGGKKIRFELDCIKLTNNPNCEWESYGFNVKIVHEISEPANVNRIIISSSDFQVELLPSKGLSVGRAFYNNIPLFWEPPISLPNPDTLDLLSDEIAINSKKAEGFTYLKTFTGGIEMFGLKNWGMPRKEENENRLYPLHGETSNIPVKNIEVVINNNEIRLTGTFIYKTFIEGTKKVWYEKGKALCEVTKTIIIPKDKPVIRLSDSIKNTTKESMILDWGYHITFFPESGSKLLVPSSLVEERSGKVLPTDFETWYPAKEKRIRTETGIIHKGLKKYYSDKGELNTVLVIYPNKNGIKLSFPAFPYFQTWFCKGGANSHEFTYASNGFPVFKRNWDGMGIEVGSSALDHDGNIDGNVNYNNTVMPENDYDIEIEIEFLSPECTQELQKDIVKYNESCRKRNARNLY